MKLIGGDWNPNSAQVNDKPPKPAGNGKKATPDGYNRPVLTNMDADAVSLVASKLSKQESLSKVQKQEIDEKNEQISKLEKELEMIKLVSSDHDMSEFRKLQHDHETLEKENADLKKFLLDKGLNWVGPNKLPKKVEDAKTAPKPKKELDLEIVAKRIEELNIIAERDAKKFENKDGAYRFSVFFVKSAT